MNRRLSSVALLAVSALGFSLVAGAPAHAEETTSETTAIPTPGDVRSPGSARLSRSNAEASSTPITISTLKLYRDASWDLLVGRSADITSQVQLRGTISGDFNLKHINADVYVNGKKKQTIRLYGTTTRTYWKRSVGNGKTQLRNLRAYGWFTSNPSQDVSFALPTRSNTVQVRRDIVRHQAHLKLTRKSGRLTARAIGWRAYQPKGKATRVGKTVALQRHSKGKWRTIKRIKINAKGNGKTTFRVKKKFKYRIKVPTTSTIQGASTSPGRKI